MSQNEEPLCYQNKDYIHWRANYESSSSNLWKYLLLCVQNVRSKWVEERVCTCLWWEIIFLFVLTIKEIEVKLKHIGKSVQENVAHPNLIQDRWSMKWSSHFRLPYLCRFGFIIEEEKICMQGEVQFIRYDNYFTCWTSCQKHKLLFETFCRYALYYILYKNNTLLERLWSLFAMSYCKQPHNLHHPYYSLSV